MTTKYRFPHDIQELIIDALPQDTAISGKPPNIKYTFIPMGHSKALHPDAMLVSGIRGAGKSFWWTVLYSKKHRQMVAHLLPNSNIGENTKVFLGFGESPNPEDYPNKHTLVQVSKKFDPQQIWRCVVLLQVIKNTPEGRSLPVSEWSDKVQWVIDNPQKVEKLLYNADTSSAEVKLPPMHLGEGASGIIKDIQSLGVFKVMTDKRINIPDVYRVGYGLGRKGGIKAAANE
ncbi:MAG: hypothetical protein SFH39_08660 [Candidatus Magnetobacterium sp. LHC-1]|uniref:Terminase n=1 Tax=Candidatus Magnetobacterium casense TaxID=1455061 RepID=A0ABS6RZW4_9BACT|nr:hypothetical protein [Candidatus Magnetobacterium casensis]MBF0609208.1 hypothetical protein [Nitrospirota bacterium]MBV6341917.1 hypothetical protein [Candidatus Magnetobacterium casensis]